MYTIRTFYYETPAAKYNEKLCKVLKAEPNTPLSQLFVDQASEVKSFLVVNNTFKQNGIYTPCSQKLLDTTLSEFLESNEISTFPTHVGQDFKFHIFLHSYVPKSIFKNEIINKFFTTFLLHTNFHLPKTIQQLLQYFEKTENNILLLQFIKELKDHPLTKSCKPDVRQRFIQKEIQLEKRLFSKQVVEVVEVVEVVVDLTKEEEEETEEDQNEAPYTSFPSPPSLSYEEPNEAIDHPFSPESEPTKEKEQPLEPLELKQENELLRKQICELKKKYQTKQKLLTKLGQKGLLFRSNYNLRHNQTKPFKPPKTLNN